MVDIAKQVAYWQAGAEEALAGSHDMLEKGRTRFGLFFAHLALEKLLKALVCKQTRELAPWVHNLVRLAELAQLGLSQEQADLLAEANEFHVDGRYPDPLAVAPTIAEAQRQLGRIEELFQCLLPRL